MHHCANVVTRRQGDPQAVLLRAAEGPTGAPARLLSGPGKLTAALGITAAATGADLLGMASVQRLPATAGPRPRIGVSPRIGVDYAGDAKDWPLRFFDLDSRPSPGDDPAP